jgi:hypothetical protein
MSYRYQRIHKTTIELNRDKTIEFKPENVLKWYKSESGFYFIRYPPVKGYDIIHTVADKNTIKHHYKKNFMSLTYKCYFTKLDKNLYVGYNGSFMRLYFCESNKFKLEDVPLSVKKAIEVFELNNQDIRHLPKTYLPNKVKL